MLKLYWLTTVPLNWLFYSRSGVCKRRLTDTHTRTDNTHLVTSAEMISVIVLLSSLRSSSMGPGMGSCCRRCSALRICCLFCHIVSASFSHLKHNAKTHRINRHLTSPHCLLYNVLQRVKLRCCKMLQRCQTEQNQEKNKGWQRTSACVSLGRSQ